MIERAIRLFPGLVLCVGVTGIAMLLERVEVRFAGQPYLEALVIAILLGVAIRTAWTPGTTWNDGIQSAPRFCWRSRSSCSVHPSAPAPLRRSG